MSSISESEELLRARTQIQPHDETIFQYSEGLLKEHPFPFLPQIFDESGLVSENGRRIIRKFDSVSPDIKFFFGFCACTDPNSIISIDSVTKDPVTPLFVFRFVDSIRDAFDAIPNTMSEARFWLSKFFRVIVLEVKTLLLLDTIGTLCSYVVERLEKLGAPNSLMQLFTGVIIDSILEISRYQTLRIVPGQLRIDILAECAYFDQCLASTRDNWIYIPEEQPDAVQIARDHYIMLSKLASSMIFDGKVTGKTKVILEFRKKQEFTALTDFNILQVKYLNTQSFYELENICLILPIYSHYSLIKLTLMRRIKRYEDVAVEAVERYMLEPGPSLSVALADETGVQTLFIGHYECLMSFVYAKGSNSIGSGIHIPEGRTLLSMLDAICDSLVEKWIDNAQSTIIPNSKLYSMLMEVCLKFAIPAPVAFLTLVKKMLKGWCLSRRYMDILTLLFLHAFASIHNCPSKAITDALFTDIMDELKEKVKLGFIVQFSNPGLVEATSYTSLLILMSFLVDDQIFDDFLITVKTIALKNIVSEIGYKLSPIERNIPLSSAMRRILNFCKTTTGNSFSRKNITQVLSYLTERGEAIQAFYDSRGVPAMLDMSKDIRNILIQFGRDLFDVFCDIDPKIETEQIRPFLESYRGFTAAFSIQLEPQRLIPQLRVCLSVVTQRIINYVDYVIKHDPYTVYDGKHRTSSSFIGLFRIMRSSFAFIQELNITDKEVHPLISDYFEGCITAGRKYIDQILALILQRFDKKLVKEIEALKNRYKEDSGPVPTESQFVVMVNNVMMFSKYWNEFLTDMKPQTFGYDCNIDISEICGNYQAIIKGIQQLLALTISKAVASEIRTKLWLLNTKRKILLSPNASRYIINPEFLDKTSRLYLSLFDGIVSIIEEEINGLEQARSLETNGRIVASVLAGFDIGMINGITGVSKTEAVKKKRLVLILEFYEVLKQYVFQHIVVHNKSYTEDLYKNHTKFTSFLASHVNFTEKQWETEIQKLDADLKTCAAIIIQSMSTRSTKFQDLYLELGKTLVPRFIDM